LPTNIPNEAEFELQVAFRKNYNWGAFFKEKWRDTADSTQYNSDLGLNPTRLPCDSTDISLANDKILCFDDTAAPYTTSYELLFPTGMGLNGNDLAPNSDGKDTYVYPEGSTGSTGKVFNTLADSENTGGFVCNCRFHKGVNALDPACPETTTNLLGKLQTSESGYPANDPPVIAEPTFFLGEIMPTNSTLLDRAINSCTPWSEVFGFFYGDGGFNIEGIVVKVTEIDFDNTVLGNSFRGTSTKFKHLYDAGYLTGTTPFTAYFTGGNRLRSLNNNPQGRFRLETAVKFNPADPLNASPIGGQIPMLPVPYTVYPGAMFQIPAYDRDGDQVRFFLGNQQEQGGLLLNPTRAGVATYHRDVYTRAICEEFTGPNTFANCASTGKTGLSADFTGKYGINTKYLANEAAGNLMPQWDEAVNLPYAPEDLSIDYKTGVVTWVTGTDMATGSTQIENGISVNYSPKKTGFYNLVVMVEERKLGDTDTAFVRNPNAIKIPIDFLLYLYPAVHFCNKDCDNRGVNNILQTFESRRGVYGDSEVGGVYPLSGSGQCKICGGGGAYLNPTGDVGATLGVSAEEDDVVYDPFAYKNATFYCDVQSIRTNHIYPDGKFFSDANHAGGAEDVEFGFVSDLGFNYTFPYNFTGCLGAGPEDSESSSSIVPYSGEFDVCNSNTPPFFLTPETKYIGDTPLLEFLDPNTGLNRARVSMERGQTVEFTLQAYDEDQCTEVTISDVGLSTNMALLAPTRVSTFSDAEVLSGAKAQNSVERVFSWPAYSTLSGELISTTNAGLDERDQLTVACFFASDKYLLTSFPFHCIEIRLLTPTKIQWCSDEPENGKPYESYLGQEECISMCVSKSPTTMVAYNIVVRPVSVDKPGEFPRGAGTFDYPYDTINFPASGKFNRLQDSTAALDPWNVDFCVTPSTEEECVFTMCFEGIDVDTIVVINGVDNYESTDVRCFIFQVSNFVLSFTPTIYDSGTALMVATDEIWVHNSVVSSELSAQEGYSVSAWVLPECAYLDVTDPVNRTVIQFASTRDNVLPNGPGLDDGLEIRSAIMFADTSAGKGYFYYFDTHGGPFVTEEVACGIWHYVALTVAVGGSGNLYVDGSLTGYDIATSIDLHKQPHVSFQTSSRPDDEVYTITTVQPNALDTCTLTNGLPPCTIANNLTVTGYPGYFRVGGGFYGFIDEVRVWNKALSAAEVDVDKFTRQVFTGENNLVLNYPWSDDVPVNWRNAIVASNDLKAPNKNAYPGMTPCVLGVDIVIGPVVGGCMLDVRVWQAAPSTQLTCRFGEYESRAEYVTQTHIRCEAPMANSPQFVTVTSSNNGGVYTNTSAVGKAVQYLYMDSVLYLDGGDVSGANLDGVCSELIDKQVNGGEKQVTFGGWFCPNCSPEA